MTRPILTYILITCGLVFITLGFTACQSATSSISRAARETSADASAIIDNMDALEGQVSPTGAPFRGGHAGAGAGNQGARGDDSGRATQGRGQDSLVGDGAGQPDMGSAHRDSAGGLHLLRGGAIDPQGIGADRVIHPSGDSGRDAESGATRRGSNRGGPGGEQAEPRDREPQIIGPALPDGVPAGIQESKGESVMDGLLVFIGLVLAVLHVPAAWFFAGQLYGGKIRAELNSLIQRIDGKAS